MKAYIALFISNKKLYSNELINIILICINHKFQRFFQNLLISVNIIPIMY